MASLSGIEASIGLKDISVDVKVPPNDVARLMYYLRSVLKSCGVDIIQDDLVDYQNYRRLSSQRQDQVFLAAYTYSPDELINKTIFLDSDGSACGTSRNKFFEVSEDLKLFHAQAQVLIVGEQRKATKIMVFRQSWLEQFYVDPMKRNLQRLRRAMISTISNHCEHCAGRSGRCACNECPRTAESKCSRTIAISGLMTALSEALDQSLEEEKAKAAKRHCSHCKGLESGCGCEEGCFKPAKASCITVHKTVLCDACKENPIIGPRYKCSECANYDLCQACYKSNKHVLTHAFYLIERVGSPKKLLEPRMKPKPAPSLPPPPPPPRFPSLQPEPKAIPTAQRSNTQRKGFFYESMSIAEMKSFLRESGESFDDVVEKEDLRRKVWECYCDSISAAEIAQVAKDTGVDISSCRDIKSRRNTVKSAFRAEQRPAQPISQGLGTNTFNKDQTVVLCGLKTAGMNGKKGLVVDPNAPDGRVDVFLEDTARTVRVKTENLQPDVELLD